MKTWINENGHTVGEFESKDEANCPPWCDEDHGGRMWVGDPSDLCHSRTAMFPIERPDGLMAGAVVGCEPVGGTADVSIFDEYGRPLNVEEITVATARELADATRAVVDGIDPLHALPVRRLPIGATS